MTAVVTAVVMEPEPEPEHEDMGAEEGGFEDLTSSSLFQSVMYAETPEQMAARLRSERDETQATLQTAAELGMALQQDTEGKDEQLAELEEALAEKTRELEEAQYRTEEVEQQMREVDERYRERERQLEEREQEVCPLRHLRRSPSHRSVSSLPRRAGGGGASRRAAITFPALRQPDSLRKRAGSGGRGEGQRKGGADTGGRHEGGAPQARDRGPHDTRRAGT